MSDEKRYTQSNPPLSASPWRFAIAASRFNESIVDALLNAAEDALSEHDAESINVVRVPGALELPICCQRLAMTGHYDAILALGCVIRGDTPHFEYVCSESARGLMEVSLKFNLPIINGVLTTDNEQQALVRAQDKNNNKGYDAACTAMEILAELAKLPDQQNS